MSRKSDKHRTSGGMFDEPQEKPNAESGMFAEDRARQKASGTKGTVLNVVIVILLLAVLVTALVLSEKLLSDYGGWFRRGR